MFKELFDLMSGFNVKMNLQKSDDSLIVSIQPVQIGDTKESFPPLILKGTPEEMDAEFITKIKNAMVKTEGIMTNISFYAGQMKQKEDAAKDKAMKNAKPGATKAAATTAKADLFETANSEDDGE